MIVRARLASNPYFETDGVVRCDCFLLELDRDSLTSPPALVQLVSAPGTKSPLPEWQAGDVLELEPAMDYFWNDVEETGRCYLSLKIIVTCQGREGFLPSMVPINPDRTDFS